MKQGTTTVKGLPKQTPEQKRLLNWLRNGNRLKIDTESEYWRWASMVGATSLKEAIKQATPDQINKLLQLRDELKAGI